MTHPEPRFAHPGVERAHFQVTLRQVVLPRAGVETFPDISQFQGQVDWDQLAAAHQAGTIAGVMIRAGFGSSGVDAQFQANQQGARSRGIPAMYYLFCYPAYASAGDHATHFNNLVGGLQPNEAMCGDFEDDPGALPFPRGQAGLQWCEQFLSLLETPLNATWAYSYPSLISEVGLQPLWATWPFWLADYSVTPDAVFDFAMARQYTDCASVPGVSGCCDQSRVLRAPLSQWLTGGDLVLDPNDPIVQQLLQGSGAAVQARNVLLTGRDNAQPTGTPGPWGIADGQGDSYARQTLAAVHALQPPAVDVVALAAALATHLPPAIDEAQLAADLAKVLPGLEGPALVAALAAQLAKA